MPKSKIIIDDDIDFEVKVDDFETNSDDAFEEEAQPIEYDVPPEVDEQKSGGSTDNDATSEASTNGVDHVSLKTLLTSGFSLDYVYTQSSDTSALLIANNAYSNVEIAWFGDSLVLHQPEINKPETQDLDPMITEFCFGKTDVSDDWHEVGDLHADEFIFADPDVEDLIATSASATLGSLPGHALIGDEAIVAQLFIEEQSGKQSATLFEHDQGELGSFTNIWLEENGGPDTQGFVLLDTFDFFM
ncbi:MAG: hypothetical protein ABJP66_06600 [Hyphomicrobiales bacterium]|uniref:hypothetical protein n=1 Tax=Shimia thalassica TaxID=1715693 RepID=UPI0032998357